jgi:hypothetical protein
MTTEDRLIELLRSDAEQYGPGDGREAITRRVRARRRARTTRRIGFAVVAVGVAAAVAILLLSPSSSRRVTTVNMPPPVTRTTQETTSTVVPGMPVPAEIVGDPGGVILAELHAVESAVPAGAQVKRSIVDEPKFDSCDGKAGSFGYDPVAVQVDFSWDKAQSVVLASVRGALEAAGWSWTGPTPTTFRGQNYGTGDAIGTWSSMLQGGRPATAALVPASTGWSLIAEAPATLPPPSGCGH